MVYVIAGISGSGKTVVGTAVAARLRWPFYDADDFHSAANIAKMSAGIPLDDADRAPWLATLADKIREWNATGGAVLACSALKKAYRERLRQGGTVTFVFLEVPPEVVAARLKQRQHHFMPTSLLASQLATLEISPDVICVDATADVAGVVQRVLAALGR